MQTRSQRWSATAFQRVEAANTLYRDKGTRQKYRTSCRKMAGLIHQAGLLQAVVFQVARDEQGRRYIDDLVSALGRSDVPDGVAWIRKLQEASALEYMAFTADAREIAIWFSRFADIAFADVAPEAKPSHG